MGSAIGTALGIAGSIFGGISASKAMKQVKNNLNAQRAENRNWYDRNYNEDATQRLDAQSALNKAQEAYREHNRAAAGAQAVAGGTEESVAATKAANARALSEATEQIAIASAKRKDMIDQQYRSKDEALQSELNDLERQKAGAISQATKEAVDAGGNIAEML